MLMSKSVLFVVLVLVLVLLPSSASAATLALSTFDNSAEGWMVGDLWSPSAGIPSAANYQASGGMPDEGHIWTRDTYSWVAFQAPSVFLGNQSAAYGGSLQFWLRDDFVDNVAAYPAVVLTDGSLFLQYRTPLPPAGTWTAFDIPLIASAGWEVITPPNNSGGAGTVASEAQLQAVLAALLRLTISADWKGGDDLTRLDTVSVCGPSGCGVEESPAPVPEPATLMLLGTGVAALARRRLRGRA